MYCAGYKSLYPNEQGSSTRSPAGAGYSYGAVVLASCVGALFPEGAARVLGPVLLVGLLGLGIAHGACDQLVLPAYRPGRSTGWAYLLRFGAGYLGLAIVVGLGWWWRPGAAVGLFFLLSAWHWGSADAPAYPRRGVWLLHSLLRGALLLLLPAGWWPLETAQHVNGLLALAGAAPLVASHWPGVVAGLGGLVLAGHLVLWAYFSWQRVPGRWHHDALEVGLLAGLFWALPPLLGLGVYFVFWHSLQHVLRLTPLLGYRAKAGRPWLALGQEMAFFGRRALPMLGLSGILLASAYALQRTWLSGGSTWLGLAVLAAAVLTLPHALLVSLVMDAPKWQRASKGLADSDRH
ncbi:MAG: Brp/Blh family beta-carotene 15,15'-dioxygenase [Janthinobacterium lividum]